MQNPARHVSIQLPRQPGGSPRVLCYSPYAGWALHGAWEMTILHALDFRGADVRYVLCDGLYSDCDMYTDILRDRRSCERCQASAARLAQSMAMDFQWLGRYVLPAEMKEAERWAESLEPDDFMTATYNGWQIGEWVESSAYTHFRAGELDLNDPEVMAAFRNYLESGLVACFGLTRLLDDYQPDVLFLFNGRMSSTRIAFELARGRGIRTICHERGQLKESVCLFENITANTKRLFDDLWRHWGDIPLNADECETILKYLSDRACGRNLSWTALSPPPQALDEVRRNLDLKPERPVWALYTSSDWEIKRLPEWRGDFNSQFEWIERSIRYAREHPEIDLVIRVHPNIGQEKKMGFHRLNQLEELMPLFKSCPPNVRVIMPEDPISSYTLMDLATLGLVYHSTVGLEMACRGQHVVSAAGSQYSGHPYVHTVTDAARYESMLDELRTLPLLARDLHIQRLACRMAYAIFFRWNVPFSLVKMPDTYTPELAYEDTAALGPGREPNLDRICRIILEGESFCPWPTDEEHQRTEEKEIEWWKKAKEKNQTQNPKSGKRPQTADRRPQVPGSILWAGPALDPGDAGEETRQCIYGLALEGADLKVVPEKQCARVAELRPEEMQALDLLMQNTLAEQFVSAQQTSPRFFQSDPQAIASLGRTTCETDRLPVEWVPRCNALDEIWVPSDFHFEAFAWSGVERHKLHVIPELVDVDAFKQPGPVLDLPARRGFHFLSVVDWSPASGWDLTLRSYVREFEAGEDVCLFFQTAPEAAVPHEHIVERLRWYLENVIGKQPARIPDVAVLPAQSRPSDRPALYRAMHVCVQPSRGAGWARPVLEAMAAGRPAIATAWGTGRDTLSFENVFPLHYSLVDVPPDAVKEKPGWKGHRWAEPSADQLQAVLREVFENRSEAGEKAAAAQAEVRAKHRPELIARQMKARLESLLEGRAMTPVRSRPALALAALDLKA